jgi:hypothetical protein
MYISVMKSMYIPCTRISIDGKYLDHYHILDIVGKCYDMQLVTIVLDQQLIRLHDPNK